MLAPHIRIEVFGEKPRPGGSKKAFYNKKAGRSMIVEASNNKDWKAAVKDAARQVFIGPLLEQPLVVVATFFLQRPKSHYGTGRNKDKLKPSAPPYPAVIPDLSKLFRSTEDALTGVIWQDDKWIVTQTLHKRYVDRWQQAGVILEVMSIGIDCISSVQKRRGPHGGTKDESREGRGGKEEEGGRGQEESGSSSEEEAGRGGQEGGKGQEGAGQDAGRSEPTPADAGAIPGDW